MSVAININGQLVLDQSIGLQDDDVNVDLAGGLLTGGLDQTFLDYLNDLALTGKQKQFAADVEGASDPNLVSVTADAGETVERLFFSDADGNAFDGDLVPGVTTLKGEALFLFSAENGSIVLAKTAGGEVAAAFFIESTNATNTTAVVQSITFIPLLHPDATDRDDSIDFSDILQVSATVRITEPVGDDIIVDDDGPVITVTSSAGTPATAAQLGNAAGQSVEGQIGWNIGTDENDYAVGDSDFVNVPTLTGTTESTGAITDVVVTAGAEDAISATFDFSFKFDIDPLTAGVQEGTAAGTLLFDKDADTFVVSLSDPVEGFTFDVLHTADVTVKAPAGNTGHPELVISELDPDEFYVQFTANSLNNNNKTFGFNSTGDGAPVGDNVFTGGDHDLITNNFEDWVSATQSTNGVAGDTIQKGELLTLRFFGENILGDVNPGAPGGGTERTDPTTTTSGVAIKFDGIGNSEDLVVVLDLIDGNGNEITRAVNVQNSDFIKGTVPAPYDAEFSLDNNDALLVIESNDYNLAGETYEIQGMQIMQSANGLSGTGINLNGAVGVNGGSSGTQAWDSTDNDVLKITDIGFIQTDIGFQDAFLDFAFQIQDGDFDVTGVQHIHTHVSNDFIL